jgi:hypothetical protein
MKVLIAELRENYKHDPNPYLAQTVQELAEAIVDIEYEESESNPYQGEYNG